VKSSLQGEPDLTADLPHTEFGNVTKYVRGLEAIFCFGDLLAGANSRIVRAAEKDDEDNEKEVGAVEDSTREHGVIRRAILVYRQAALELRAKPSADAYSHALSAWAW
jgi:hypothetical protein